MAPRRSRARKSSVSESGTSVADTDPDGDSATSARPRRSRLPKRYHDEDYSPPPAKKRASRRSPTDSGDDDDDAKSTVSNQTNKAASTRSTPKPKGKSRRPPVSAKRKSKRIEEEVIYMDEDSEDESSDEEFLPAVDQDELEEDLELGDIKLEKVDDDEPFCPWLDADPDTLPRLELPESSLDIPLPNHATFDAIEVYEILRSYHRTLRITPFTFEDFCAALISKNNSCIMAEVHIALLKICLKSDDEELTNYSVTETNNAVNIMIHHLEAMTYAEVLRQYIEAYPFADSSVRDAINADNYPYVGYEPKLVVLLFMCYRFLYSSEYRKVVNNSGKFQNDDNCRVCGKSSGRIVGCTQCEAAFHVECSRLNPFPEVLVCNICTSNNNVKGVADALPFGETVDKEPLRSQPIGRDRYGRYYWFVARRLVVQSLDESEIHYYSTPPQLYQLLQRLDRHYYERELCDAIRARINEFLEQMTMTVELTSQRRDDAIENSAKKNQMSFEYLDSLTPQIYFHRDNMKRMASILRDCAEKSAIKQEVKEEEEEDDEATRSSGPLEAPKTEEDDILSDANIGIYDGRLINAFWSGGASQEELVAYYLDKKTDEKIDALALWRMGDELNDQTFMAYHNYYSRNEMAEGTAMRKKAADKKKYMSSRYSTLDNFEWVLAKDRKFYGNSVLHTKSVAWSMARIIKSIPVDLMHRRYPEVMKAFEAEVHGAEDYRQLATCLLKLDALARKTIFMAQWWSGLGQTKMERHTVEQRELFAKEQQKVKKAELDALAKDLDDSFLRVNYSKPKWPNTYILRQKGETFRNASKGAMGGWWWVSNKYSADRVPVPEAPKLPLAVTEHEQKTEPVANRKARRLELLVGKIERRRRDAEKRKGAPEVANFRLVNKCYTPSCSSLNDPPAHNPMCYSPSCRYGHLDLVRQRYEEQEMARNGVLGEERAWPIPEIQTFTTKRGKSLFVLQKKVLRQLIATAGCSQVYMPGFLPGAKSNLLIWPYHAPRPTLDLCWKWQTLNARSLHAVALQLKILWSSIKWNEFDPDDTHPDRRVVIDTPNHDERRRIIHHKENPPFGQYERYELEIEIIPLYEEHEEEDESWTSRRDRVDPATLRSSTRKKPRSVRGIDNRQATAIRKEWVDGVTLKVYEIRDYWKWVRTEAEKAHRKRVEAVRRANRAREEAEERREKERARLAAVAAKKKAMAANGPPRIQAERPTVPYVGARRPPQEMPGGNSNGRYLEMYNTSQIPPTTPKPAIRHVAPNPIVRKMPSVNQPLQYTDCRYQQQQPSTSRAAAGADGTYVVMQSPHGSPQQFQRRTINGYQVPEGAIRGGGGGGGRPVLAAGGTPRPKIVHQAQFLKPFGEPITDMRRAMPVAEEAVAANAVASDGDEQPPVIPRYERNTMMAPEPQQQQRAPVRQVYNVASGQMRALATTAGPAGAKNSYIIVKSNDGNPSKMMFRPTATHSPAAAHMMVDHQPVLAPGTVLSGPRVVVRPSGGQQVRQAYPPAGTPRFIRVQQQPHPSGAARQVEQVVRRAVPMQRQMFQDYADDQGAGSQQVRYVLQSSQVPTKVARVVPRGGMTMQMVQQQQHPTQSAQPTLDSQMVAQEAVHEATGFAVSAKEQEEQ